MIELILINNLFQILETKGETLRAIPILQKAATLDADNKSIQNVRLINYLIK